jgi:cytochrome oxidase Cu insertion factor (SCO1/SenC/PrrC family)
MLTPKPELRQKLEAYMRVCNQLGVHVVVLPFEFDPRHDAEENIALAITAFGQSHTSFRPKISQMVTSCTTMYQMYFVATSVR